MQVVSQLRTKQAIKLCLHNFDHNEAAWQSLLGGGGRGNHSM